jgi:hypothetical protein
MSMPHETNPIQFSNFAPLGENGPAVAPVTLGMLPIAVLP